MNVPEYFSTRGEPSPKQPISFEKTVLAGLASDGGLFVPTFFPKFSDEDFARFHKKNNSFDSSKASELTFQDLAFEIMRLYIPKSEIPDEDLINLISKSYSTFRSDKITPLNQLSNNILALELFHGPTYAFKDVALQFLGNLFEYFISKSSDKITVLGATSGDTGSSAIYGLRGKENVEVFILFPEGRVSPIQELQMTTVPDTNVHCLAVEGNFDDAQRIVKSLFSDADFKKQVSLSAVNSINFARILAQITYYFHAYFQAIKLKEVGSDFKISFAVPTGNFGDILAGWYAKNMGLPVEKLVVGTNKNDILYRFFEKNGDYTADLSVEQTLAPSMDICVSSNFERFLFHMHPNCADIAELMKKIKDNNGLNFGEDEKFKFLVEKCKAEMSATRCSDQEILDVIKAEHTETGYVLDPHSACAVHSVSSLNVASNEIMVCLGCAHWGKFSGAIKDAVGDAPMTGILESFPEPLEALKTQEKRKKIIPATEECVRKEVLQTLKLI